MAHKRPFRSIIECTDLKGKYVLLRGSLNVPVKDNQVVNQFRLTRGLPTLNYLVRAGARVILMGHISTNKATEKTESLAPVFEVLKTYLPITFSPEVSSSVSKDLAEKLCDGEVLLLENLRQDPREKKNDLDFARSLADLADIYVNDAFPVSHREHASLVGVPHFLPSYVGMNFIHEYEELQKARNPKHPSLFILGGAKFDTKLPLIEKYLAIYDTVFVGGALANDLFAAKGFEVGTSLVSEIDRSTLTPLLDYPSLMLPVDVTVMEGNQVRVTTPDQVRPTERILDAGPETIAMLAPLVSEAAMVLWNGPLGNYEAGFDKQTSEVARIIAEAPGYSVIGGGDTITAIEAMGKQEQFNFLSTAGGAMLDFLEHGTMPAIEALQVSDAKYA